MKATIAAAMILGIPTIILSGDETGKNLNHKKSK